MLPYMTVRPQCNALPLDKYSVGQRRTLYLLFTVAQGHEAKVTTMQQVQCTVTLYYGSTTMMKTTEY